MDNWSLLLNLDLFPQIFATGHAAIFTAAVQQEPVHFNRARFIAVLSIPSSFSNRLFLWF